MHRKIILAVLTLTAALARFASPAGAFERTDTVPIDAFFRYDKTLPFNEEIKLERESPFTKTELIWYDSIHDKRVPAILTVPKKGNGPFPLIVMMHGYGMKKDLGPMADNIIGQKGYALFAIDAEYRNERSVEGKDVFSKYIYSSRDAFIQTMVDVMRGLDYLESRPEIDMNRVGMMGLSMGSIIGSSLYSMEPRFRCASFAVGGANFLEASGKSLFSPGKRMVGELGGMGELEEAMKDEAFMKMVREAMAPMEPLNFVHRSKGRPTMMANGRLDELVPPEMAWELYNGFGEPKHIIWFDAGHVPAMDKILELVNDLLDWFSTYLKPEKIHRVAEADNRTPTLTEFHAEVGPEGVPQNESFTAYAKADDPDRNIAFVKVFAPCGGFELLLQDSGKGIDKEKNDGIYTGKGTVFERSELGKCELQAKAVDRWGEVSQTLTQEILVTPLVFPEGSVAPTIDEIVIPGKIVAGEKFNYRIQASDENNDLEQVIIGIRELGLKIVLPLPANGLVEDSLTLPEEFLELLPPGIYHLTAQAKDKAKRYSEEKAAEVTISAAEPKAG